MAPEDHAARVTLAEISEWAGQPLLALEHWTWLAHRSSDIRYYERAVALARANWDQERLLELTLLAAKNDRAKQIEAAELYVKLGRPEAARDYLERLIAGIRAIDSAGTPCSQCTARWPILAPWAATWQRIDKFFGMTDARSAPGSRPCGAPATPDRALDVFEDRFLIRSQRRVFAGAGIDNQMALAALQPIPDRSVRMVAALSWQLERMKTTRVAHHTLWNRAVATWTEVERLIIAANVTGAVDLALQVAEATWREHRRPEAMLRGMQIAHDAGRWDDLARLEKIASSDEYLLARADYWRLRRARRQHSLRMALAHNAFDDAQSILADLDRDLSTAARFSAEFARHPDYRTQWSDLYRQQLYVALQRQDMVLVESILDRARGELENTAEYWRVRLALHHRELSRAIENGDYNRASAILAEMDAALSQAEKRGFGDHEGLASLRDDVKQQAFYLAVARGDRKTVAQLVDVVDIPAIDRAHALEALDDRDRAVSVALAARDRASDPEVRRQLDESIESNTRRLARQIGIRARALALDRLTIVEAGPEVEFTRGRFGIKAAATGSRLTPTGPMNTGEMGAGSIDESQMRLAASVTTRYTRTELAGGATHRGEDTRAAFDVAHGFYFGPWLAFGARGGHESDDRGQRRAALSGPSRPRQSVAFTAPGQASLCPRTDYWLPRSDARRRVSRCGHRYSGKRRRPALAPSAGVEPALARARSFLAVVRRRAVYPAIDDPV